MRYKLGGGGKMGWIFLREKPGHGIQRLFFFMVGGRGRGTEYSFFFAMGSGKKGLMIWGCAFISLQFLFLSVSLMVWFFFSHFLGMSHSRVRFCFYFAGIFPREIVLYFGVSTLTIPFIFD